MDVHLLSRPVSFSVSPAPLRLLADCGSAVFPMAFSVSLLHRGVIIAACDVVVGDGEKLAAMEVMVGGL